WSPPSTTFNVTLQRETIARLLVEATYFFNAGRDRPYALNLNQVNPQIINKQGAALNAQVTNPFYQLLPEDKMRGPLRNQRTVSLQSLLRPYPQYASVQQSNTGVVSARATTRCNSASSARSSTGSISCWRTTTIR